MDKLYSIKRSFYGFFEDSFEDSPEDFFEGSSFQCFSPGYKFYSRKLSFLFMIPSPSCMFHSFLSVPAKRFSALSCFYRSFFLFSNRCRCSAASVAVSAAAASASSSSAAAAAAPPVIDWPTFVVICESPISCKRPQRHQQASPSPSLSLSLCLSHSLPLSSFALPPPPAAPLASAFSTSYARRSQSRGNLTKLLWCSQTRSLNGFIITTQRQRR